MTRYRLERPGDVDLGFDGILLANESSRDTPAQLRWSEIRLYATDTGLFVTEKVGKSVVPGEVDLRTVEIHTSVDTIRAALMHGQRRTGGAYMPDLAYDALQVAAEKDARLRPILTERI